MDNEPFESLKSDYSEQQIIKDLIRIIDITKSKKRALQLIESIRQSPKTENVLDALVRCRLAQNDIWFLKKVSSFLEISRYTCGILERNFFCLLSFVKRIVTIITDENGVSTFNDTVSVGEHTVLAVKVCLQCFQFLHTKVAEVLKDSSKEGYDDLKYIVQCLLTILCEKHFPKDSCLLSGTAIALLFNLSTEIDIGHKVGELIDHLSWNSHQSHVEMFEGMLLETTDTISSMFAQISLINGLVIIGVKFLMSTCDENGQSLFAKILDTILGECLLVPDANSKYLCFKTILNWLNYLMVSRERLKYFISISKKSNNGLFLNMQSTYLKPLWNLVKNHIEDLVDGVPQYTQKIFGRILQLHSIENEMNGLTLGENKLIKELMECILVQQVWYMKGRWMLLAELIPHLGIKQLKERKSQFSDDLVKCLTTCSLPAISNEVYQVILKEIKKETDISARKDLWASMFLEIFLNVFNSDTLIVRQNIGQYWLPSTFRLLPKCFNVLETAMKERSTTHTIHSNLIIVKVAWSSGLLSIKELEKRRELLSNASRNFDLDVRIEAFNVLCSNPKKTELLPKFLQDIVLNYVRNNLNCDSTKFRQQMFSALKRLLVNIRESSIVLQRKISSETMKRRTEYQDMAETLLNLIDFVEELLKISRSCLSPGSSFQRVKSGLLLLELLTDLFVYVKDTSKCKKGAATDSFLELLEYVNKEDSSKGNLTRKRWNILYSMDMELLLCIENQHDEIRELALKILLYKKSLLNTEELKERSFDFQKMMNVSVNLLDSPKLHEVESGGSYFYYISQLLSDHPGISTHLFICENSIENLLEFLLCGANKALASSSKDFLLAAAKKPIFGYSVALYQVLRCISEAKCYSMFQNGSVNQGDNIIYRILTYCLNLTKTMVSLLAGTFYDKSNVEEQAQVSPSFADINEAMDILLKSSPSYLKLSSKISHHRCRELVLSFCWLNLKCTSFIITELGNISLFSNTKMDALCMNLTESFYKLTLIRCRHKGVIENSYASLSKFSNTLAGVPSLWAIISRWCQNILSVSTDLSQRSSVTKRSAGIPMFIQPILSAEPSTQNHELLQTSIRHLFTIAKVDVTPGNLNSSNNSTAYDLPQFNAINILRSIFRDTTLANSVLSYVEEAVILTIHGFSSPSWSIRNASTQLLGTLLPRMLGQRLSQGENRQQNMTTVDVFFYRYSKLKPVFEEFLREQSSFLQASSLAILPNLIPVLTFLSKLKSSENKSVLSISDTFLPLLHQLKRSAMYTIRDLTASSILAFTPVSAYHAVVKAYFIKLTTSESISQNILHCSTLVLYRMLNGNKEYVHNISTVITTHLLDDTSLEKLSKASYVTRSLILDFLSKCVVFKCETGDEDKCAEYCLKKYVINWLDMLQKQNGCRIGKPFFEKSLSKSSVTLLSMTHSDHQNLLEIILRNQSYDHIQDFMEYFFGDVEKSFKSFDNEMKHALSKIVTNWIRLKQTGLKLSSSNLPKCLSSVLPFVEQKDIEDLLSIFFQPLQSSNLQPVPELFIVVSKMFSLMLENQDLHVVLTNHMEKIANLSLSMEKYSQPDHDENLRFAIAQSLSLFHFIIKEKQNYEHRDILKNVIKRYFWMTLNLLQDEDEEIRQEATKNSQLFNQLNHETILEQSNITLQNFFRLPTYFPQHTKTFLHWLLDVIIMKNERNVLNDDSDLMLFEQESSNLFAEEFVITELGMEAIKISICILKENGFYRDNACFYKDQSKCYLMLYKHCKTLYKDIQKKYTTGHIQGKRSIIGIFRNRRNYNDLFKLVEILKFLIQQQWEINILQSHFKQLPQILQKVNLFGNTSSEVIRFIDV